MRGKHFLTFLCFLVFVNWTHASGESISFFAYEGNVAVKCSKYLPVDHRQNFTITHARILQVEKAGDKDFKIVGNILCNFDKRDTKHRYIDFQLKCDVSNKKRNIDLNDELTFVTVSVAPTKHMMSSQIEYRYQERVMQMFKNGFTDPTKIAEQSFTHDNNLLIGVIKYNDGKEYKHRMDNCFDAYPDSIISNHGIYVATINNKPDTIKWTRMYFDPNGVGEHIILE